MILIILFIFQFLSCNMLEPLMQKDSKYFPVEVGNWWTYDVIKVSPQSNDSTHIGMLKTMIKSLDTLHTRQQVFKWEIFSTDTNITNLIFDSSIFYTNFRDNELILHNSLTDSAGDVLYKFPLFIGDTWKRKNNLISVVDTLKNISVPAGNFSSCFRIHSKGGWWQAPINKFEWIKKGIGIIKIVYRQTGLLNYNIVLNLTHYHIEIEK